MNPHFTEKENLCIARISLRASQFELRLLKKAAKAGRIPSSRTVILRSLSRGFEKAFADPALPPAPAPATVRASGHDAANRK